MTVKEIEMIEKVLNISLTDSYKKEVKDNPFRNTSQYPNVCDSLCDDPQKLIKMNLELRNNGLQKKAWPSNLFVIGTNGDENYYFIDVDEKECSNIYAISIEERFNSKNLKKYLFCKSYNDFIEIRKFMEKLFKKR